MVTTQINQLQAQSTCPNCHLQYSKTADYCPNCGQKSGLGLRSVWYMLMQFFANTFNIESKLTQTAIGLFKPGFLTREYLAIRRVNYLSPIRTFIVVMFLLFLVLSLTDTFNMKINVGTDSEGATEVNEQELNGAFILKNLSVDNYINQQLNELSDLLVKRDQSQTDINQAREAIKDLKDNLALNLEETFSMTFFGDRYEIMRRDIYQLSVGEIIDKYKISSLMDQLVFRSLLRITQDPRGFQKFLFGNLSWVFFLDVLLMAGVFKLFYPKTQYAVHFVYHLHLRSFIFLTIMLCMASYCFSF